MTTLPNNNEIADEYSCIRYHVYKCYISNDDGNKIKDKLIFKQHFKEIELCPTKAVSQRTQLSGIYLKQLKVTENLKLTRIW